MPIDFLVNYAWVTWLALILIFLVIEMFTLDFTFLMIAVGSAGGLLVSFTSTPFWLQVIVVAVLAVLLIFAVRPPLLRRLRRGEDPTLSNLDALIGMSGTVAADFADGTGHVKLANGETWTARLSPVSDGLEREGLKRDGLELEAGHKVSVISIEGATAVVAPIERIAL